MSKELYTYEDLLYGNFSYKVDKTEIADLYQKEKRKTEKEAQIQKEVTKKMAEAVLK